MVRNENAAVEIPHGLVAASEQVADLVHVGFIAEMAVRLVADLHHADVAAGLGNGRQHPGRPFVNFACKGVVIVLCPVLRALLLGGIRPEIGILNVHQQLHAVCRCPPCNFAGGIDVVVAAAVAVAAAVIRLIPDAHTDIIHIMIVQHPEQIRFVPGLVMEDHTGLLDRNDAGNIHAADRLAAVDGCGEGTVYDLPVIGLRFLHRGQPRTEQDGSSQNRCDGSEQFHTDSSFVVSELIASAAKTASFPGKLIFVSVLI